MTHYTIFLDFLRVNKITKQFFWNYKQSGQKNIQKTFERMPEYIIAASFTFSETDEGHRFWFDIQNKWQEIYKQLIGEK